MKKLLLSFIFLNIVFTGFAQQNNSWKGYFSYNEIKDVTQSATAFFAASENALFSKSLSDNSIKTINTVDGLSGQTITAIYHSTVSNKTMIGYENGLIIIINQSDGSMLNVVDIINKQLPANIKRVNHFMEYDGIVYISCDFGIVQYSLSTFGFGDTYFIGNGGNEISVRQTAVFDGYLYAATIDGIRRALVTDPNLIDFSQWTMITPGNFTGVESFGSELLAVNSTGMIFRYNGTAFNNFSTLSSPAVDIRSSSGYLIITTASTVNVYNQQLGIATQVQSTSIPEVSAIFTSATVISDTIYIGTRENGVITTTLGNAFNFEFISPNGPLRNSVFAIDTSSSNLWAVFGDYTQEYDPDPLQYLGISKYNQDGWINIPYDQLHPPGKEANDLVRIAVNPQNEEQVYISSYNSGLLKLENNQLVNFYDHTNSGLESLFFPPSPSYVSVRIEQAVFDRQGNLWMTNGLVKNALKVLRADGSWQSYDMDPIISSYVDNRYGRMVIDKNNTKWIATSSEGVVGFNENGNIYKQITFGSENGNLPIADVRAIAIDNRNQLWIGTTKGLRVLSSVDRFQSDGQMNSNAIIILEDDVAQELLFEQFITDIVVDGANNKWIATADSGVFLLSPNGQQTIHRFTTSNSPLPSNSINDIDINGQTGEVFFATPKGLVSYKGIATDASANLNSVYIYPNPVRPQFSGTVKISGLLDKANVKIADIEGNLVYEVISEGGTIEWDTTAFGKYKVASGVYMVFISAEDGVETKVKKVMIIR